MIQCVYKLNLNQSTMKNIFVLGFLSLSLALSSQVISEDEFRQMVKSAQDNSSGAHPSVVSRTNADFAKSIWGKKVRFNEAEIIRFFNHASGEKVSAGVDIFSADKKNWNHAMDQQVAADLFTANGVRVTNSYNTLWIKARQDILYAENTLQDPKIILELYCPQQSLLEVLRMGQTQSIEFLITGYWGSVNSSSRILGILTQVHTEKQVSKCSNGHEFDKALGYKFCPSCGEALE